MKLSFRIIAFALLVFCFICSHEISAQPFTLKENINPIELKFHPFNPSKIENEKGKGKINITEINQVKDTLYFYARNLSIYSPIYVSVDAEVPDPKINVGIYKMNWINANQSGKTNAEGHWDTKFKTEMDFGIMVVPEETPIKYTLLAWSGDEADFDMPSTFFEDEVKENSSKGGISKMTLMYIVIGVLALALLFMFLKNKKR